MRKTIALSLAALLLLAGIWICRGVREAMLSARAVQEMSKMRYLGQVVSTEFGRYYGENACYPSALADLNLAADRLTDEGASLKDLDRFAYRSDGDSFSLIWHHPEHGFKVYGSGTNRTFEPLNPPAASIVPLSTNSWRLLHKPNGSAQSLKQKRADSHPPRS